MALTPAIYYAELAAFRAAGAFPFGGTAFDKLAWAIAKAMGTWGPTVQLQGVTAGTAGAGTMAVPLTRVILTPNAPLFIGGMASAGMVGPLSLSLSTVVSLALASAISKFGQYAGASVGVGVGADVSKVVRADQASLTGLILAQLGPGPAAPQMAKGLAAGISLLLLTATGAGTVVGSVSPAAASGTSTSVLV